MNEKAADNYMSEEKKEIKKIDNEIYNEKNKKNKIDNLEETFVSLNKNINKCIDLLYTSMKGGNVDKKLDSIREESEINYRRSVEDLDVERQRIDDKISQLSDERDELSDKIRQESNNKFYEELEGTDASSKPNGIWG